MAPNTTGTQLVQELGSNIAGKTVLITGASPNSIGALFAEKISSAGPAMLILTGRSEASIQATADAVNKINPAVAVKPLLFDFSSLESVRGAAREVLGWADVPRIDVLVNNAGIMAVPYGKTADGFERTFGVNHLGPFLFTNLIMSKVLASKKPRIVVVSSDGHLASPIRWYDVGFKDGKVYEKWLAYGQSKTANNLFALALAKRLGGKGAQAYSVHPGVYLSNLGQHLDWEEAVPALKATGDMIGSQFGKTDYEFEFLDADQIIAGHIVASFSQDLKDHNGAHVYNARIADPYKNEVATWGRDEIEADKLWILSEELVGEKFSF